MSIYALPVSVQDLLDLQESIQFFTNEAQATSQAAAINGGTSTVYDYALQLLDANLATSQVAMAVPSLILNETPAVDTLANVSLNFLPAQIDFAISQGLDPVVYAAEAWAVNTANDNAAAFDALYGALSATQFATVVSTTTGVNTTAILQFINNWEDFYTNNPSAIPANLDVQSASYAAAFGDAIGNALVDDSPFTEGVNAFAENALLTIATGQYVAGVAPGDIPPHTPLQGEENLRLTVDVDHLSTSAPGQVFDGAPGGNPPLGTTNTLNTGDTLTDTALDGVLNVTFVNDFLGNPKFAVGVTMDGLSTANILNVADPGFFFTPSGFAGHVSGLTDVTIEAGSTDFGFVQIGQYGVGTGLLTALENVTFNASHELDAILDAGALSGAETLDVTLNGVDSFLFLDVTTGTTGYGEIDIHSNTGENFLGIDTGFDTVATVVADGAQDLELYGDVLNVANLDLFNGSAATGDLTVGDFFGTGDVTALGGSGNDDFFFYTDGAVDVSGNAGNDDFTFYTDFGSPTTFTAADVADGGAGENRLILEAYLGELLGAGVGPNITDIQTIQHIDFDFNGMDGDLTVDMARSGSATTLDLHASDYNFFNVDVTNLTNADTVVYSGNFIDDLTLTHASPVGIINFEMAADAAFTSFDADFGDFQIVRDFVVATGGLLNIHSTGAADSNIIEDANAIDAHVSITGDVDLYLGIDSPITGPDAYDFFGGIIDASTFTGNLHVAIDGVGQTVIGGFGDDYIQVQNAPTFITDLIDLSVGGSDTVEFQDSFAGNSAPTTGVNYTFVDGFDVADDAINVNALDIGTFTTTAGFNVSLFPNITDLTTLVYTTGSTPDGDVGIGYNFIKVDNPVNTFFQDPQAGFDAALSGGSIAIDASTDDVLFAYFDNTHQQMVLGLVDDANFFSAGVIDSADDFDVIALIGMTKAEYDAFGGANGNINFINV